jgi:hypothetical protein
VLHAESFALIKPAGPITRDEPLDVIMMTNTASHSTSAVIPVDASANAATDVRIGPGDTAINSSSSFFFHSGSSSSASVSGTATFTEDQTEHLTPYFTASANRGGGGVTIKDASNAVIANFSSSSPPVGTPPQVVLTPGDRFARPA